VGGPECRSQIARGMTHRNVETLIGRLATDPILRRRFSDNPIALLHELKDHGLELTAVELDALASTDVDAIRSFAHALDRRIRRAEVAPVNDTHER
jgi:hypothetical protein